MGNASGTTPTNTHIQNWIKHIAAICQPGDVFWCDGSEAEKEQLTEIALQYGDLTPLNEKELPGCYLHRSTLNDVVRTENLTSVCTEEKEDAEWGCKPEEPTFERFLPEKK